MIESVDATGASSPGTATIRGGLDLTDLSYLYLIGLRLVAGGDAPMNTSGNDALHIAGSDHVLVRGVVAEGPPGRSDTTSNVQEVLKTNQVDDLYVEDSDLSGTHQTVVVYDNVFYNPPDAVAAFTLGVNGPLALPDDAQNFPAPPRADEGLVFAGNVFWNGGGGDLLASTGGGEIGCDDAHPTCTRARLLAENVVDGEEPALVDPAGGDLRPTPGGNVATRATTPIPPFVWGEFPAGSRVPAGTLDNEVRSTFTARPGAKRRTPGRSDAGADQRSAAAIAVRNEVVGRPMRRRRSPVESSSCPFEMPTSLSARSCASGAGRPKPVSASR